MRVKVEATTVWFNDGDELVEKYPFLKDSRFKMELVPTGHNREFFRDGRWQNREKREAYITIDSLKDLQSFIKSAKKCNEDIYDGQTILMLGDDGDWRIEIYDGYRE